VAGYVGLSDKWPIQRPRSRLLFQEDNFLDADSSEVASWKDKGRKPERQNLFRWEMIGALIYAPRRHGGMIESGPETRI